MRLTSLGFHFRRVSLAAALSASCAVQAAQELIFWHSSTGAPALALEQLVARFNASQSRYQVSARYIAQESDLAELGVPAAERPHLVQLDDAAVGSLMAASGPTRPLWQVMAEAGQPLDASRLLPALAAKFVDRSGRLAAWPLASATPVLYANRALLRNAGVDPGQLPRTWYEMPKLLGELYEKGIACPYTTAWPSWVQLENLSAWHNQAFATHANGLGGEAKLVFNTQLMVRHIAMLASWAKARYFVYSGRRDDADRRFANGECALLTSSSASYEALQAALGADLGVGRLPYYDDFADAPQNTLGKGGALWVASGKPAADYRGVAEFVAFLASAPVQAEWHQKTGFLPLSREAYDITRKAGFYDTRAGQEAAVAQVLGKAPRENSRGIRLQHFAQIRDIIDDELEAAWSLTKMPKEALDSAVERGNKLLAPRHAQPPSQPVRYRASRKR